MSNNENLPNEKTEILYNEGGNTLQNLIERAFEIYLRSGSYSRDKGDKTNE